MSSIPEFNTTVDCRDSDNGGYAQIDRQHYNYRQQRRLLRKSFERQLSDKHLKRRAQIMQSESNNMSRRYQYQHHHNISNPLVLNDQRQNHQHQWHRGLGHGNFFSAHTKRRRILMIIPLLILLVLITSLIGWYSIGLPPTTIGTMPAMFMGVNGDVENNGKGDHDDSVRSYQDLADSIKRLRIRRQVMKEETLGEWGGRIEEPVTGNNNDFNNGDQNEVKQNHDNRVFSDGDEEDARLKALEQRIQMDQNKKIREELSAENSEYRHQGGQHHDRQYKEQNSTSQSALKDKLMSENIAALKLFNENKKKESN